MTEKAIISNFYDALMSMDKEKSRDISEEISSNLNNLDSIMTKTLEIIGDEWSSGKASLAQVYMSGVICEELANQYFPYTDHGRDVDIAIATLEDHHVLGKRIVKAVVSSAGYHVEDYGVVTVNSLKALVQTKKPKILLISTLMIGSALKVKNFIEAIESIREDITIYVGGAPFRLDRELSNKVGADGFANTAFDAVHLLSQHDLEIRKTI